MRSGKDTAAAPLIAAGWHHASFAAALKDFALAVNPLIPDPTGRRFYRLAELVRAYGWERAKDDYPEVRALLQRVGTDAGRVVLGDNVWVDAAMRSLTAADVVFTDVRFGNEADAIRAAGGIVIRIERPGTAPGGHASETALDDYDFDATIRNNGTVGDLHTAVQVIVSQERETQAEALTVLAG